MVAQAVPPAFPRIDFSPEALGDGIDLYGYIAVHDGAERAIVIPCSPIVATGATICTAPQPGGARSRRIGSRPGTSLRVDTL